MKEIFNSEEEKEAVQRLWFLLKGKGRKPLSGPEYDYDEHLTLFVKGDRAVSILGILLDEKKRTIITNQEEMRNMLVYLKEGTIVPDEKEMIDKMNEVIATGRLGSIPMPRNTDLSRRVVGKIRQLNYFRYPDSYGVSELLNDYEYVPAPHLIRWIERALEEETGI